MTTHASANPPPAPFPVPLPANRAQVLLNSLKRALEQFLGRGLSYRELGDYAQQAAGTVFDKLQKADHGQIEALLGWLERLPVDTRTRLLNAGCRELPCLRHARLRHDPTQITGLMALLRQPTGLTLVLGKTAGLRSWLITALAHGSRMQEPDQRLVTGIDRHVADWFVPVPGVHYLGSSPTAPASAQTLRTILAKCKSTNAGMACFNDVASLDPGIRKELLKMANHRNVFVADDQAAIGAWFSKHSPPAIRPRKLMVLPAESDRIRVRIEPLKQMGRR